MLSSLIETIEMTVPVNGTTGKPLGLSATLALPAPPTGVVIIAHGGGTSRRSPRTAAVAAVLHESWIGTLLLDLLTEDEAARGASVFDVALLAERLLAAVRLVSALEATKHLPLGLFGVSTGAAAALAAAACDPGVKAVVSRGGRPDLAGRRLRAVRVPTLLVVVDDDGDALERNRQALAEIDAAEKELAVVPGATHRHQETDGPAEAAQLTAEWFTDHLHA
jgi:putative phosphoribosyl transferase